MKTRFQRLSFALGLSLLSGMFTGKITEKETCIQTWDDYPKDRVEFNCKHYVKAYKHQIKTTSFNTKSAIATSFAVFGLCLMINAFVKEENQ